MSSGSNSQVGEATEHPTINFTATIPTFSSVWERAVRSRADETFLIFEDPRGRVTQWTYQAFDSQVQRVAARLNAEGVGAGSCVHLALTNCPTFVAVWLAANRLGAWIVPADPMGKEPEFAEQIERTSPTVGFCSTSRSAQYRAGVANAAAVASVPAVLAGSAPPEAMTVIEIDETDATFEPFAETEFTAWATPEPTDLAAVMFTSGTTGRPKGVSVTQANYAFAGKIMAQAADLTPEDRQLVVLPLFHANAQYYSFASAIWTGASVALMHTFSASGFLPQAARHQATCASLFAAPLRMILARGGPVQGLKLRHCWFAQNLADDQYQTICDWFGCRPRQLYGMTETIPAVLTDGPGDPRPDSMGFVTAGCEVEIHNPDGMRCTADELGEVVVKGTPGVTIFGGYFEDPATTAANYRGEWFRTGDRAWHDTEGRFFFDGRRSDVLKVSGENVSTVEIEAVLCAHPLVLEASVIGAPDPIRNEVPMAFVVPADTTNPPENEDLLQWCDRRLSKHKQPHQITLLSELPRTSVGKIRKFMLKQGAGV
ncbi:MAG: ATP-dependent acyl-CoA ligase [Acidimicrobiaceae bacterium]|nr:ATP-dependent acyl-CoA ligase [Acidimicrobiaceae bacterium]